jgi:predicted DNA binding CopG/RHH family protein
MRTKHSKSAVHAGRVRGSAGRTGDKRIDFSDIRETTTEELKRAHRVGRPVTGKAKRLIAIRISPRLLAELRRLAAKEDRPYQTLIHELLERAKKRRAA